jgi:hypothetical protein
MSVADPSAVARNVSPDVQGSGGIAVIGVTAHHEPRQVAAVLPTV